MRATIFITYLLTLYSFSNTFRAEKMSTENISGMIYETYLVSNVSDVKEKRYPVLMPFIKKRLVDMCETGSVANTFGFDFYDTISCIRRYFENYDHLKDTESLIERCEAYYCGSFRYEKSKEKRDNGF